MKPAGITLLFLLLQTIVYTQTNEELKHCNCTDKIATLSPVPDGAFERKCAGKVIETGTFRNGKKDGLWITYSTSGKVLRKMTYVNDSLNGTVELFYPNGKPKLTASFVNNQRNGLWTYYTSKGKSRITGEYVLNVPVNNWIIKDVEGKKILVQYDFSRSSYIQNQPADYHKAWDVVENENNAEFFLLLYPEKRFVAEGTAPLGGFLFANDLFVDLMEIPMEYWDTYVKLQFLAEFSITTDNNVTFTLSETDEIPDNVSQYIYLVKTNDSDKLQRVEHSEFSKLLLRYKINEALLFMPPWIYQGQTEIKLHIPYVINEIEGIEQLER